LARWAEALVSNLISRGLGAFLRSWLIIFGAITEIIIFFLGLFVFLGWFFLPIIFLIGILYGFKFL
jgi:hypothetical protein